MTETEQLFEKYLEVLSNHPVDEDGLNLTLVDNHISMLTHPATVGNSAVTIFDMVKRQHIFTSYNFTELLGYNSEEIKEKGNAYFDSRVHKDDFTGLLKNAIRILEFYYTLPIAERMNYKLINEYRVLNKDEKYVRVIEQHQALELDRKGNIWLTLGVTDISPNQDDTTAMRSQLINFKTGKIELLDRKDIASTILSTREKEILNMIKDGFLSKEISEKLSISIHTVNTHRQRILSKLNAFNSIEALKYAGKLGLLE